MPIYTLKQVLRGDKGQKLYLESVTQKLQSKGGHILNIQSKAGKAELPGLVRRKLKCGFGEGSQRLAGSKIREHHPGTAIAGFLTIENQAEGDAFFNPNNVR